MHLISHNRLILFIQQNVLGIDHSQDTSYWENTPNHIPSPQIQTAIAFLVFRTIILTQCPLQCPRGLLSIMAFLDALRFLPPTPHGMLFISYQFLIASELAQG